MLYLYAFYCLSGSPQGPFGTKSQIENLFKFFPWEIRISYARENMYCYQFDPHVQAGTNFLADLSKLFKSPCFTVHIKF